MTRQTRTYLAKKIAEGHTKREAIRCLKRYLAREVYYLLKAAAPSGLNTAVLTADGSSISAHSAGAQPRSTCRSTAPSAIKGLTAASTGTQSEAEEPSAPP